MQENTDYVLAEYIWTGGHGEVRSKTKVIHGVKSVELSDLPHWNFDGSSTNQAPGHDSEVVIVPRAIFPDPFRRSKTSQHVLVVTDTYTPSLKPLPTNSRYLADKIFKSKLDEIPWFGIEQEYTLFKDGRPLGWPKCNARSVTGNPLHIYGYPGPQGPYYCSAGADVAFGRDMVEEHLNHCMYAGLTMSGINAEVMPGQWEFQVGPCVGINSGDHMLAARYILKRTGEKYGVIAAFDPKPIPGDWNGTGCHTNFSTKIMREVPGSFEKVIIPAIEALGMRHQQHINSYGAHNDERLTGRHETAGIERFTYGIANRGASVRIPNATADAKMGYFEDRRPASNMDPYVVTSMIFDSSILNGKHALEFAEIKTEGVDVKVEERIPLKQEKDIAEKEEAEAATATLDKLEHQAEVETAGVASAAEPSKPMSSETIAESPAPIKAPVESAPKKASVASAESKKKAPTPQAKKSTAAANPPRKASKAAPPKKKNGCVNQ